MNQQTAKEKLRNVLIEGLPKRGEADRFLLTGRGPHAGREQLVEVDRRLGCPDRQLVKLICEFLEKQL